jgi:hypothetical protein
MLDVCRTYGFGSASRFVGSDFFYCALDLDEVDVFVAELDDASEDGLNFGEFVLVTRDEVEVCRDGGGRHFDRFSTTCERTRAVFVLIEVLLGLVWSACRGGRRR